MKLTYIGGDPEKKFFGLQKDLLEKTLAGVIPLESTERHLQLTKAQHIAFAERRNPFEKLPSLIPGTPAIFGAVKKHKTSDYFQTDERARFWRGDGNLDSQTPQERRAHKKGEYVPYALKERMQFREMVAEILGVSVGVGDEELQMQLIKGGHCVEMLQIENNILRTEAGDENTGYAKDSKWTFAFVDNYDGSVSVVFAYWRPTDCEWSVFISRFGNDYRWGPKIRVLVRNKDT